MANAQEAARFEMCRSAKLVGFLKSLSSEALNDFESITSWRSFRSGATLFREGQTPHSVLLLLDGAVKLSTSSHTGRRLILQIAKPGEVLGLTATFSGDTYQITAETLYPSTLALIPRFEFFHFLARHPGAYRSVARELSLECNLACTRLRTIGLATSVRAKLARLLLEWSASGRPMESGIQLHLSLTHGEIGECIGTSRETVTRTLNTFRRRRIVHLRGSILTILDFEALEECALS